MKTSQSLLKCNGTMQNARHVLSRYFNRCEMLMLVTAFFNAFSKQDCVLTSGDHSVCCAFKGHQLAIQHRLRPPLSTPEVTSNDRECPRKNEVRVFREERHWNRAVFCGGGYVVNETADGCHEDFAYSTAVV